ncbi:hypothetical protein HT102_06265 [Hoyosella sp. G463]|uniref:Uncharacterized protein n=1 Tax=Lolliginicoccus lacisalsi TaxID=2742202 RepID=A0A927JBE4_9ACTN|nr:DUF6350 family protein [Lolliginicoccus lacisalsi]MBD8506084.1 hypothetical protein [Lolliginicoccus lacisalsi]
MTDLHARRARASRQESRGNEMSDVARSLMKAAFVPTGAVVGAITVTIVALLLASSSDLTGVFAAVGASWLAVHQVVLPISGVHLGVLPLLLTAGMVALTFHFVRRARVVATTSRELAQLIAAATAIPVVMTIISLAVIKDASTVLKIDTPNVLIALLLTAAIHGGAATAALPPLVRERIAERITLPEWVAVALEAARRGALVLVASSAAITVALLVLSASEAIEQLLAFGGAGSFLGLGALSLLYLGNIIVGVASATIGGTVQIGEASASLFATEPASLPGLPILAIMPDGPAAAWWPLALVVPAAVAVVTGKAVTRYHLEIRDQVATVVAAAALQAGGFLVLALLASGPIGVLGSVSYAPWLASALLLAWIAVLGTVTATTTARIADRHERRERRAEIERAIAEALEDEKDHDEKDHAKEPAGEQGAEKAEGADQAADAPSGPAAPKATEPEKPSGLPSPRAALATAGKLLPSIPGRPGRRKKDQAEAKKAPEAKGQDGEKPNEDDGAQPAASASAPRPPASSDDASPDDTTAKEPAKEPGESAEPPATGGTKRQRGKDTMRAPGRGRRR